MHHVILIAGFLGAWLLVAGPIYQAALELGDEVFERERIGEVARDVDAPRSVSPWWWLLPPVAYVLLARRRRAFQLQVMSRLEPEEKESLLGFVNKATGWFLVAGGAVLIASKETFELVEGFEWPGWLFSVLLVVGVVASTSYTVQRVRQGSEIRTEDHDKAIS